jgi:dTDP-4-dehydrorhamnose reductase
MLGRALVSHLKRGHDEVFSWDIGDGDLAEEKTAAKAVEGCRPGFVVNCAGYTDVEGCEDPKNAKAVHAGNVLIPRNLARICARRKAVLVQISTDYVFDGEKKTPYLEDDETNPISEYGRSKLEGEQAVIEEIPHAYIIIRTAWLYGPHGKNFVDTILKKVQTTGTLNVVDDQHGCPTYVNDLAAAVGACIKTKYWGIMHAVNAGRTTWCGLAARILEESHIDDIVVNPVSTGQYPTKARRPKNSVFSCERLADVADYRFRSWSEALADYLKSRGH